MADKATFEDWRNKEESLVRAIKEGSVVYSDGGPLCVFDGEGNIVAMFAKPNVSVVQAPTERQPSKLDKVLNGISMCILFLCLWVMVIASTIGIINWVLL